MRFLDKVKTAYSQITADVKKGDWEQLESRLETAGDVEYVVLQVADWIVKHVPTQYAEDAQTKRNAVKTLHDAANLLRSLPPA